jgi:hypothetical protein
MLISKEIFPYIFILDGIIGLSWISVSNSGQRGARSGSVINNTATE